MDRKTASYLGLARKSGNLLTGTDTCTRAGRKGKIKLLIICEDTAEGSKKKMIKLAEDNNIPLACMDHLSSCHTLQGTSQDIFSE